jgi:hypothetical protein
VPGTRTAPDQRGIYRAEVEIWDPSRGRWVRKQPPSTFFPDHWSRQRVIDEVDTAFQNKTFIGPRHWRGTSHSGVMIDGYVNQAGELTTAFPRWP